MKQIECVNEDGIAIKFDYEFNPFFLLECNGIMGVDNNLYTTDNAMIDGSTYQGSTLKERNIEIVAQMKEDYKKNRDLLYNLFKLKSEGEFRYTEEEETRVIKYRVESLEMDEKGIVRDIEVSLICPDPYFQAEYPTTVSFSSWESIFEWPHEFLEEKEELGVWHAEYIKEIPNENGVPNVGLEILLKADGPVVNPIISHVETGKYLKVLVTLQSGDELIITTGTNNKYIYLVRNGEKTEINNLLEENSEFFQLVSRENHVQYDASQGKEYLQVSVEYVYRFLGV